MLKRIVLRPKARRYRIDETAFSAGHWGMTEMDRIALLRQFLAENPKDEFARYGLGMEYRRAGQREAAVGEFRTLIEANPDYTAAYFMAAQALAEAGRSDEAKQFLRDGIASAARTGNQHARSEMEGMLEELERV